MALSPIQIWTEFFQFWIFENFYGTRGSLNRGILQLFSKNFRHQVPAPDGKFCSEFFRIKVHFCRWCHPVVEIWTKIRFLHKFLPKRIHSISFQSLRYFYFFRRILITIINYGNSSLIYIIVILILGFSTWFRFLSSIEIDFSYIQKFLFDSSLPLNLPCLTRMFQLSYID